MAGREHVARDDSVSLSADTDMMQASRRSVRVWDAPLRIFHWLLAVVVAFAFISAEEESVLSAWHVPAGWAIAVLIAFRITWGFVGGENARFSNFPNPTKIPQHIVSIFQRRTEASTGHSALGALATLVILGTVAAVVYSGAYSDEELHEGIANALLVVIGFHVVAVIVTSLLTRDNLIRAFITGSKRAALFPGVPDAGSSVRLALPVAAFAIGGSTYGATLLDANAFAPGVHGEVGERQASDASRAGDEGE